MSDGSFEKKLGDPLSKSIFSNFVGLDFYQEYIIVETNLTQCFYLGNFKNTCPLFPTFAAPESAICKTQIVLI